MSDRRTKRDPPVEPMKGSAWWFETGPQPLEDDIETATLVIRLELALHALQAQGELVPHIEADMPEGSPERMRTVFLALLTYAAYTKETINILTGTKQAPGQFQRVLSLARQNKVPSSVVKKVTRICSGAHPGSAIITKMRNELGFHWDPASIRAALSEFATNDSIIWVESSGKADQLVVHRLAIDVAALALFPVPDSPDLSADEQAAQARKRITQALSHVGDAGETMIRFLNHAVLGFLRTVNAERKQR